jgi:hypothetical protein
MSVPRGENIDGDHGRGRAPLLTMAVDLVMRPAERRMILKSRLPEPSRPRLRSSRASPTGRMLVAIKAVICRADQPAAVSRTRRRHTPSEHSRLYGSGAWGWKIAYHETIAS